MPTWPTSPKYTLSYTSSAYLAYFSKVHTFIYAHCRHAYLPMHSTAADMEVRKCSNFRASSRQKFSPRLLMSMSTPTMVSWGLRKTGTACILLTCVRFAVYTSVKPVRVYSTIWPSMGPCSFLHLAHSVNEQTHASLHVRKHAIHEHRHTSVMDSD